MPLPVTARRSGVGVTDRPADVVVTAHIGQPPGPGRRRRHPLQRRTGEGGPTLGQHRPAQHHQLIVVRQVALASLAFVPAEVGHQVIGRHDRFGEDDGGRSTHAEHRTQRLGDQVRRRLVLAVRAQLLAGEGNRVQAEHVHAEIGEEQHDAAHLHQHPGVRPVEVPLEAVEGGPHPAAELGDVGEVARGQIGKDLGQGALVGVRQRPVRIGQVEGQGVRVARSRRLRPWVAVGGVVHDQVEHEAAPRSVQAADKGAKVVEGAEGRVDVAIVVDGVAAVVLASPGPQHAHQVHHVDAELLQVRHALAHALQSAAEVVGVGDVADPAGLLEPVRFELAGQVTCRQSGRAGAVRAGDGGQHRRLHLGGSVAVEATQRRPQVGLPLCGPAGQVAHGWDARGPRPCRARVNRRDAP